MLPDLRYIILLAVTLFLSILLFTYKIYLHFTKKIEKQQRQNMQSVLESQENERRNIAREVHDNLCPLLSITNMQVEAVMNEIANTENIMQLSEIQKQLKDAIFICRDISHELTPFLNEHNGLYDMVNDYIIKINRTGKLTIDFDCALQQVTIHNQKAASICRIILELLNNTIKHAKANKVTIQMVAKDKHFVLAYTDDGIGNKELEVKGIGLKNIASRVQLLNGELHFEQTRNTNGYEVTIKIPTSELS